MTVLVGVVVVGLGGGAGALIRWRLTRMNGAWPRGTFIANMSGSLALGMLVGLDRGRGVPPLVLLGVGSGVLGGLTTFSTLAVEVVGGPTHRWRYLVVTIVVGVLLAWLGIAGGQRLA